MKTLSQTIQDQEEFAAQQCKEKDEKTSLLIYAARQVKPELVKDAKAALELQRGLSSNTVDPIGVACDTCGTELVNRSPGIVMLSNPPCIAIGCAGCGWTGYKR